MFNGKMTPGDDPDPDPVTPPAESGGTPKPPTDGD